MPKKLEGQTKEEFISYCISFIKKYESDKANWSTGRLYKHCEALWNEQNKKSSNSLALEIANTLIADGYVPTAFEYSNSQFMKIEDGTISMSNMSVEKKDDGRIYTVVDAVAAVGDRFYGNVYVPSDILRATSNQWNSTYNDLSHLATMFPAGLGATENLEYITGYNSDGMFDESINAVRIKMHINQAAPKYQAWKNFVDVSRDAGRTPNVSIFGFAKYKAVKPENMSMNSKVSKDKLANGYVIVLSDIIPFAVTTCLKGKCDEAAGCGINQSMSKFKKTDWTKIVNTCGTGTCENEDDNIQDDSVKKNYLENRLKELKLKNGER